MKKDPAFLFYPQDFIVGCQMLSMAERGQYITLLSMMHQTGRMDEETIRLLVGSVSVNLLAKFEQDDEGKYYNHRLEYEIERRRNFVESRRANGSKGGRKQVVTKKGKVKKNTPNHVDTDSFAKTNLPVIVNVNENVINLLMPYQTENWNQCWQRWLEYRSEIKHPYKSQKSIDRQLNWFAQFPEHEAVKIVEESMRNSWVGLFPLKVSDGKKPPRASRFDEALKQLKNERNA